MFTAVRSPDDASLKNKQFSYVVCANKALDTSPTASEQIAPLVGPDTCIVLIQNGVGNEEEFQKAFPENTVLSGVVSFVPSTCVLWLIASNRLG